MPKEIVVYMGSTICNFLSDINSLLWGDFTLIIVLFAAVFLSIRCRFIYILHPVKVLKYTLFSKEVDNDSDRCTMTNFQTLTTALAASMGTGNIIGVAAAISIGGAGAVFWMIVSAFFVMSFAFTENVLATIYKNRSGSSDASGPLPYLRSVFGSDNIALTFSAVCMCASFVIGNITQVSSAADSLDNFHISKPMCGIIFAVLTAVTVLCGRTNIAAVTEKLVPFAACFYIVGSLIVILLYGNNITNILTEIITSAFGIKQFSGGIFGCSLAKTISVGVRRGLFSNEAGMGTSTFAHTSSKCKEPVVMGFWAALEVFIDTVLLCTLTALVILCTGADKLDFSAADTVISAFTFGFETAANKLSFLSKFSTSFAHFGAIFLAISNSVFAFASVIGWYFYGERSCCFLQNCSSKKLLPYYKFLYISAAFFGAVINTDIVWELADLFTFLMLVPNLSAILLLSNQVKPFLTLNSSNFDT